MTVRIDKDAWVVVYLAGGMKSEWQDTVIEKCGHKKIQFLDPREHGLTDERDYTAWDLWAVRQSDYVFGYLEKDNPGGHGLMVEFGYGVGAITHLIFVEDEGDERSRFYGMARTLATEHFTNFDIAIEYLYNCLNLHLVAGGEPYETEKRVPKKVKEEEK